MDELAQRMGMAGASSIQRYVKDGEYKKDSITPDLAKKLIKALVGRGAPPIVAAEIWELTGLPGASSTWISSFDPDAPVVDEEPRPALSSKDIPEIDIIAGLGGGGVALLENVSKNGIVFSQEVVRDHWRLPEPMLMRMNVKASHVAAFPAQGDSMLPTIEDGDVVFIDTRHRVPSPPGIYALADEFGGVVVKRLEVTSGDSPEEIMVRISSDNPRHLARERALSEIYIIGRFIGRFTSK
ncbi:S24 family peptidase [Rhizobium sp. AG207R]|uniref:S24 family peptidase n=1 Tax=Rhizobium sp. AG207R TaxID=2802287 RepID=UPI0022AC183B|nr:S24 family peptidase [Rhizobium sp. AG207R]MCZ3377461.1 S24 family peptidase [Rhizobium sp. AG207R]